MRNPGIGSSGIALHVSNFKKSVAFYRKVLGLNVEIYSPGHFAQIPSVNINLVGFDERVVSKGFHVELEVDDVDAWCERLKKLGVDVGDGPEDKPWGERNLYIEDPDGHTLEISSPIKKGSKRA